MEMRQYGAALVVLAWAMGLAGATLSIPALAQQTFFVNSLADDPLQVEDDYLCVTDNGECTFRAALEAANNRIDTVTIEFSPDIETDTAGRSIIQPVSGLPSISNQVIIRGDSHPNFSQTNPFPRFLIDGDDSEGQFGLYLVNGSQGSEVLHVAAYNFSGAGFVLGGTGNVVLQGNYSGLQPLIPDLAGEAGNGFFGIWISDSNNNTIENNWVGANGFQGIMISDGSADNILIDNRVGLRPVLASPGVAVAGNGDTGIQVNPNAGSGNRIGHCRIISTIPFIQECRGNIITGNGGTGIRLGADSQFLTGNWIGVAPEAPTEANFGNAGHGILIESDGNVTVSGLDGSGGHLIGHNGTAGSASGIRLANDAGNNLISNCIVGTDSDSNDLGNSGSGISIAASAGQGNEISGCRIENNANGISLQAPNNSVSANEIIDNGLIGIEAMAAPLSIDENVIGSHELAGILSQHSNAGQFVTIRENHLGVRPNGANIGNARGILVVSGPTRIGASGERGNVIGFNAFAGIEINGASSTSIQSNHIGRTPDLDPAGNNGPGILITSNLDDATSLSALIGYQQGADIPFNPIPDGSGSGGLGNIITNNTIGILIDSDASNVTLERHRIRGNSIFGNNVGGIQLGDDIGHIDPGGGASGPNTLLNHPQLDDGATWLDVNTSPQTLHFRYRIPTAAENARYPLRIDFYAVNSGETQGRSWVSYDEYSESDAGQWRSGTLTPLPGILTTAFGGSEIVAKATDVDGNSSEFSAVSANVSSQDDPQPNDILVSAVADHPNADPASPFCDTGQPQIAPGVPHCTLRAAIQAANNQSGEVFIDFWEGIATNAEGRSVYSLQSPLPVIGAGVWIRGNTHPGWSNMDQPPSVIINGAGLSSGNGLTIANAINGFGESTRIVAVAVHGFPDYGIEVIDSSRVFVVASSVGLEPMGIGEGQSGNAAGGILVSGSDIIPIEHSWISANDGNGIMAVNDSNDVRIWQTNIGLLRNPIEPGVLPAGNTLHGIAIASGKDALVLESRIENNEGYGIILLDGPGYIEDNLILDNGPVGIGVGNMGQDIKNNIIGGHSMAGILYSHSEMAGIDGVINIYGNHIGVTPDGEDIGNQYGVIGSAAGFANIGNNDARGNVIGFNDDGGILLNSTSLNFVQANHVGIMPDGTPAGNGGPGITVSTFSEGGVASNNVLGYQAVFSIPDDHVGASSSLGNVIAHNQIGVLIDADEEDFELLGNVIRGNQFMANASGGIKLGPDGSVIDPGGAETGPNNRQNFPEVDSEGTFFNEDSGQIEFTYLVNTTTGNASYPLQVDFYIADGATPQGHTFVYTDEYTGFFAAQPRSGSFVPPAGLNLNDAWLVATATDADGNTSQFSVPTRLTQLPDQIFSDRFE